MSSYLIKLLNYIKVPIKAFKGLFCIYKRQKRKRKHSFKKKLTVYTKKIIFNLIGFVKPFVSASIKKFLGLISSFFFKICLFCIIHSVISLLFSYWLCNRSTAIFDNHENLLTYIKVLEHKYESKNCQQCANFVEKVLCINTSLDPELIEFNDRSKMGQKAIVDRKKLMRLFDILNDNNKHKLILCNIPFVDAHPTLDDSLIYEMNKTKNLIISQGINPLVDKYKKIELGADVFYLTSFGNQFFKYQYFINDSTSSIALKMWNHLNNGQIRYKNKLYFSAGSLCLNSNIIDFPTQAICPENIVDMGFLLSEFSEDDVQLVAENKIILIGDFHQYDVFPTIVGELPRVLIHYYAYNTLVNGKHILSMPIIILLFIFYFPLNILLFVSIKNKYVSKIKSRPIVHLFIKAVSYSLLFVLVVLLFYVIFGIHLNILLMAIYYTAISYLIKIRSFFHEKT